MPWKCTKCGAQFTDLDEVKKHRSRCLCGPHLKNIEYVPIEIPKIDLNTKDEPSEIPDYIKYLPDYVKYLPNYVKYLPDYVKYMDS